MTTIERPLQVASTELNTENGQTMQTILDKQENIIFIGDDLIICFAQRKQLNAMISIAHRYHLLLLLLLVLGAFKSIDSRLNRQTIDWK